MAKISPVSIKYMIYADFEAEGKLEKPDVIGALFGQTEGLLGSDLEMRELQKEGKIGRIEVELISQDSKTTGKIQIPSALDKTETTLIGAAIETIERIGPSNAKISIEKIEDVRENKREYILQRAKKLLEGIEQGMPKSREITQNIKDSSREEKIKEYGDEKLPCGDIKGEEIIVVEGRADVVNLLRNGVNNVIGMNGTILPKDIKELSFDKEITLFIDGDRGGRLIAENVVDNARVDFIATAPDGKEVEELTGKEILLSLRKKIPVQEFLKYKGRNFGSKKIEEKEMKIKKEVVEVKIDEEKVKEFLKQVENTKDVIILDKNGKEIYKTSTRGLFSSLRKLEEQGKTLVLDTATQNVIDTADKSGIKNIAAKTFLFKGDTSVNLISL